MDGCSESSTRHFVESEANIYMLSKLNEARSITPQTGSVSEALLLVLHLDTCDAQHE